MNINPISTKILNNVTTMTVHIAYKISKNKYIHIFILMGNEILHLYVTDEKMEKMGGRDSNTRISDR